MHIQLKILASDILEGDYLDSRDCPITRALRREGLPYKDLGVEIIDKNREVIVNCENPSYQALAEKVVGMFSTKDDTDYSHNNGISKRLPVEDFEHILID